MDHDRFIQEYLEEMKNTRDDSIDRWSELDQLITHDPNEAWILLRRFADHVEDEDIASRIGAGPLEEFLITHESYASEACAFAQINERFREMLRAVRTTDMSAESKSCIESAVRPNT